MITKPPREPVANGPGKTGRGKRQNGAAPGVAHPNDPHFRAGQTVLEPGRVEPCRTPGTCMRRQHRASARASRGRKSSESFAKLVTAAVLRSDAGSLCIIWQQQEHQHLEVQPRNQVVNVIRVNSRSIRTRGLNLNILS